MPARSRTFGGPRDARLDRSLSGTNLALAGDYNQRIVLQSIRLGGTVTRPELAQSTGLTMATILNITRRLAELDLIVENGRTEGSRGQPAVRLAINPDGGFSIGVNIDRSGLTILLLDLTRRVRAIRRFEEPYLLPADVMRRVERSIEEIVVEQSISFERIIGLGVAIPDDLGAVELPDRPADYAAWGGIDLVDILSSIWSGAIHIDNDAAAAALGEAQFGLGRYHRSFFYMLISAGLGGSLVLDGSHYRGASGRSGELGFLRSGGKTLQDIVSLSSLGSRIVNAGPGNRDAAVDAWVEDAAAALAEPLNAIDCLINPDAVIIAGGLDKDIAAKLVARLNERPKAHMPSRATIALADIYDDAAAVGAAILPFADQLLPSQASLMKRSI